MLNDVKHHKNNKKKHRIGKKKKAGAAHGRKRASSGVYICISNSDLLLAQYNRRLHGSGDIPPSQEERGCELIMKHVLLQ